MSVHSEEIAINSLGSIRNNDNCCVGDMFRETRAVILIGMKVVHEWRSPSVCFKSVTGPFSTAYSAEMGFADLFRPGSVDFTLERLENLESQIIINARDKSNLNISHQQMCDLKRMLSTKFEEDVRAFTAAKAREELQDNVNAVTEQKPKPVVLLTWFRGGELHKCADEQEFYKNYDEFNQKWGHLFRDPNQVRDPSSSLALVKARNFLAKDSETYTSCSICLDMLPVGRKVRETPCSHVYHMHCIRKWFEKTNTCPMCRNILGNPAPVEDEEEEEVVPELMTNVDALEFRSSSQTDVVSHMSNVEEARVVPEAPENSPPLLRRL